MKKAYGTYEIAGMCNVAPPTVGRWIDEGKLPFFTTGGGHRRVLAADLLAFMKAHNIPLPPSLSTPEAKRPTILIVDDEPQSLEMLVDFVRELRPGSDIQTAQDGFDAGRKTAQLRPSLLILDLNLPGIDGFDVCRMIRRDPDLAGTRILAVTGYNLEVSEAKALAAGADAFLGKPFDVAALSARLDALCGTGVGPA